MKTSRSYEDVKLLKQNEDGRRKEGGVVCVHDGSLRSLLFCFCFFFIFDVGFYGAHDIPNHAFT